MASRASGAFDGDPNVSRFVQGILETAAGLRMPELFSGAVRGSLYSVGDRQGVSVVAVRTPELTNAQLVTIMRFRMAEYLLVNFVDPTMLYTAGIEHEPLDEVSTGDVHIIAGSAATGEILCYLTLRAQEGEPPGATLRTRERQLFPVEETHGWGVFNRLPIIPDIPVSRIREMGRFMKNQQLPALHSGVRRAPIEVGLAAFDLLTGPLRGQVDAIIGELDENVAKRNLDFLHVPSIVLHGSIPYVDETSYLYPSYWSGPCPFAFLVSDFTQALPRVRAVEQALELPDSEALPVLARLKASAGARPSSLEPPAGANLLNTVDLPQRSAPPAVRRRLLDVALRLRSMDPFRSLSTSEAAVLSSLMKHVEVDEGAVIVRQGEAGDALYIVESGRALVTAGQGTDQVLELGELAAGDVFGEIALIAGGERTANVTALTPMVLQRLDSEDYFRFAAQIDEVVQQLSQTAAARAARSVQRAPGESL